MIGCHWEKYSGSVDLLAWEEGSFKGACSSGRGPCDESYALQLQVAWCSEDRHLQVAGL